jgi:hypothetical protein
MGNSILEPVAFSPDSSYVITVQGVAQTPVNVPKKATKSFILKSIADFLTTATDELRQARVNNKALLHNLK